MRKLNKKSLDDYVNNMVNLKRTFIVEKKRNVRCVYYRNKAVCMNKNPNAVTDKDKKKQNQNINNLFATVHKSINRYIVEQDFDVPKVKSNNSSTWSNREMWRELEAGETFYYIDVSHCFWRIAFLNGCISERVYKNILEKPDLKVFRNMALACIIAPRVREYYINGVRVNEISEDRSLHRRVYDNIRFTAYNLMGDCRALIPEYCFGFRNRWHHD